MVAIGDMSNIIDLAIVFILVVSALGGMSRGLVGEALQLGTMLLSIFVAGRLYVQVAGFVGRYVGDPNMAAVGGFLTAFVLSTIIISAVRDSVIRSLELRSMGGVGRLIGAAFGLAGGAVFTAAMLLLLLAYPVWALDIPIRDSSLALAMIQRTSRVVLELLPPELAPHGVPDVPTVPGRLIRGERDWPGWAIGGYVERSSEAGDRL